jgi:hypothetical protein
MPCTFLAISAPANDGRRARDNGVVPGFACAKSVAALFFEVAVYE